MKERLDVLLVKRNLASSREKAKAIIMSGNVFVDGQREDKAGTSFSEEVQIEVRGHALPYVSRGGLKLEKAMKNFDVSMEGKVCTDVGSSTGGFTDCMLQNGAVKAFAIDVGHGQLDWKLRQDERVVCMEKTNIRYVQPEDLGEPIDFSSIDVSFISLTKVLLPIRNYLKENGEIVALIKPQFEAGREKVGKKGVVREKSTHIEVIEKVTNYAVSIGFEVAALEFSPIKGPEGNIEYLVHLKKRPEEEARIVESVDIRGTVDAAFDTLAKKDPAEEKDMEKFYIITNDMKDANRKITVKIKKCIESYGKKCYLEEQPEEGNFSKIKIPKDIDCVLTVGGDGTFIQASRRLFGRELPMLGINMGTLGYLTEVEVQNVEEAVKQLVEGNYTIEERMMLYGSAAYRNVRDVALNDIVMTRSGSMKIVHFNLYVNGEFLNSYDADGLIVSTPTGSTAYNLSAGGPIVEPTASLIVVTPICSHALNSRSIVFADKDEIVIEIGAKRENQIEEAVIAYDGADEVPLHTGDRIRIKKAWETAKIVKLSKVSFLETLREKMKGN